MSFGSSSLSTTLNCAGVATLILATLVRFFGGGGGHYYESLTPQQLEWPVIDRSHDRFQRNPSQICCLYFSRSWEVLPAFYEGFPVVAWPCLPNRLHSSLTIAHAYWSPFQLEPGVVWSPPPFILPLHWDLINMLSFFWFNPPFIKRVLESIFNGVASSVSRGAYWYGWGVVGSSFLYSLRATYKGPAASSSFSYCFLYFVSECRYWTTSGLFINEGLSLDHRELRDSSGQNFFQ